MKPVQRLRDFGLDLFQPDVIDEHLDQVSYRAAASEVQVVLFEGIVDVFCQVRIALEIGAGKV